MSQFKNINELLEFAIAKEEESRHFYLSLAQSSKSLQLRGLFTQLAEEELEHKEMLELEFLKTGKVLATDQDISKLSPDDYDFENPVDMTYSEILDVAIRKERASVRLYIDLSAAVTDPEAREMLYELIEMEVKHKTQFEKVYAELFSPDED